MRYILFGGILSSSPLAKRLRVLWSNKSLAIPKRASDVGRSVFDRYNDDVADGDLTSAWPNRDYCCSPAPNSCALNCRAVGERFYATLEPAVMDGTPCDAPNLRGRGGISTERSGERWLCVAGQCKVWIARALGERTTPEINGRYRAGAMRYDQSMRSLLTRHCFGPDPPSFLSPVDIGVHRTPGQTHLSINNARDWVSPISSRLRQREMTDICSPISLEPRRIRSRSLSLKEMFKFLENYFSNWTKIEETCA